MEELEEQITTLKKEIAEHKSSEPLLKRDVAFSPLWSQWKEYLEDLEDELLSLMELRMELYERINYNGNPGL